MDHLAGFKGAPAGLLALEADLLGRADLVLTGGAQLYEAKRTSHSNVHCFPSSVDVAHFGAARRRLPDPADQAAIARPRFGYCGVIDERMDLGIVAAAAATHPDWHFVMVGPVVKIDPATLPRAANIHYLGMKTYDDLPAYLAGWDVAIMPFAHNEATRYISPTKTPEYLAAGRPVASTSIHDVVDPYGRTGLVEIGDGPTGFADACERALATDLPSLTERVDRFLAGMSWDRTWRAIDALIEQAIDRRTSQLDDTVSADVLAPAHGLAGANSRNGATAGIPSLAALE
jgi:UDP-galactopyranose mutase